MENGYKFGVTTMQVQLPLKDLELEVLLMTVVIAEEEDSVMKVVVNTTTVLLQIM
jgi:hypothetical protein